MYGVVLNFDSESSSGLIRASDGNRYRFSAVDWSSPGVALHGDIVDFEPTDGRATEIFVTKRVPISQSAPDALSSPTEERVQLASDYQDISNTLIRIIKDRPSVIAAGLIVLASFLPFVTLPAAEIVGFEGGEYNLYSSVMKLMAGLGVAEVFLPTSIVASLRLTYLLLAVPSAAVYLLWREFIGAADNRLRFRTGLLAALGPIGIPMFSLLLAVIIGGGGSLIGEVTDGAVKGVSVLSGFFGFGLMLTMASGIALMATAKGINPIKALIGSFAYLVLLDFINPHPNPGETIVNGPPPLLIFCLVSIGGGMLLIAVLKGWSLFDQLGVQSDDVDTDA